MITLTTGLPFDVPPIQTIDLPHHPTKRWETLNPLRTAEQIKRIVIHHMASEAPLDAQARFHVNSHGWPGLSYHLVISGGRILQINSWGWMTYHAASNNADTIGIAIHGDLSKRDMTSQERELLYAAILSVKAVFSGLAIVGHNEVNATACPCTSVNRIREDILALEHQMTANQSLDTRRGRAYDVYNQTRYLYSHIGKGNGDEQWALNYFDKFYSLMKQEGWFK